MSTREDVRTALEILENVEWGSGDPPAVIVMPPDSGEYMIGNAGGFVRLAVAALKAAQGEQQSFANEPWVNDYEMDWGVKGLKPDPSAHIYLPPTLTPRQRLWRGVWGYGAPLSLAICLAIGVITIIRWLMRLL
jgi:hypothetical protein